MKGLYLFITDLRRCKSKEEEVKRINNELANIRNKFKGVIPMNSYQKKKYVCKLIYIFLMGYKCQFGQIEAINLLSSNAYSEKQVGYLFISVVKGHNCDLMPLIITSVKKDLSSCTDALKNLALQFIANSTSVQLATSLADQVVNVLLSGGTTDFVKQSAILAFLQLLRVNSALVLNQFTVDYLISLIGHPNLGLATASASLTEILVKRFPSQCETCVLYCVKKLSRIVSCPFSEFRDYSYHCVAAPWLTVKLLQILQNFPAPSNFSQKTELRRSLGMILIKADVQFKVKSSFHYNNAKYAVIFEAISLIIQMKFGEPLISRALSTIESLLGSQVVNLELMALEMITRLTRNTMYLENLTSLWRAALNFLKSESDINIKKQALDFLYIVCSEHNVKPIVNEILYFLESLHEYSEDFLLQTAAIAEKFGNDRQWYFDTILHLLQMCGDKINDSIWHSLINIVIDNNGIQEYAAKVSYAVLCERNCYDTVIKTAGYILGEVGYLIESDPRSSHKLQFKVLNENYRKGSPSTKALLLTTFMKYLYSYPDLKDQLLLILKDEYNNQNDEIQKRAVEYLKLIEIAPKSLLEIVLEKIPTSLRKVRATVTATENKKSQKFYSDRIVNSPTGMNLTKSHSDDNLNSVLETPDEKEVRLIKSATHPNFQHVTSSNNQNLLVNLLKDTPILETVTDSEKSIHAPLLSCVPNNQLFLHDLLFKDKAVLYRNDIIEIVIESEFKKHFGRFHLKYMNKTANKLTEFVIEGNFANIEDKCSIRFNPCDSILLAKETIEQVMHLECLNEFSKRPFLNLKFASENQYNEVKLILPLTLNKFVEPCPMSPDAFSKRWQNFEAVGQEVVKEFIAKYPMIYGITREKLQGFRLSVIGNVTSELEHFHCSGIFHTYQRQTGFLIRLERHTLHNTYCCKVRSNQLSLSRIISNLLSELL